MKKLLLAVATVTCVLSSASASASAAEKPTNTVLNKICKNGEAYFQSFYVNDFLKIGTTYEGKEVLVDLEIHLGPNNSYIAEYSEFYAVSEPLPAPYQGVPFMGLYDKAIRGKYSVSPDGILSLENLGYGYGEILAGNPQIMYFKFTNNIHDLGVKGKVIEIDLDTEHGVCKKIN